MCSVCHLFSIGGENTWLSENCSATFGVPCFGVPYLGLSSSFGSAMFEVLAYGVLRRMQGDGGGERNRVMEQEVVD
jgi:hypothetical protein